MPKKKTQKSKTKQQLWQHQLTKTQGQYPAILSLDGRNLVNKAFIMYVAKPKFLLVRSKQNLF